MFETNLTTATTTLCQMMTIIPLLLAALTTSCFIFSLIAVCRETITTVVSQKCRH